MYRSTFLYLLIICIILFFAFGCDCKDEDDAPSASSGQGDDDDDDNDDDDVIDDDDNDDDTPSCATDMLCSKSFSCDEEDEYLDCLDWYEDDENCLAMDLFIKCACLCLDDPLIYCNEYLSCKHECKNTYCPSDDDLPHDPPIPGIPGQKQMPPTIATTLTDEENGAIVSGGGIEIHVTLDPFSFNITRTIDEQTLLSTESGESDSGFAPIAFTKNNGFYWNQFYWGYRGYVGIDKPWSHSQKALFYWEKEGRVFFLIETDKKDRGRVLFIAGPFYDGAARIAASILPGTVGVNRAAFTFLSPSDEKYAGFGERFNKINQRGKIVGHWSEEGSIEPGSLRPILEIIDPDLPAEWALPGGEHATYMPIPFYLSNYGYGLLGDIPYHCEFDMASTHNDMFRITADTDEIQVVVFAGPTPADALFQYTERTGRSLAPRPWMLAPWNMFVGYPGQSWLDVAAQFRDADIPSTVTHSWTAITPTGSHRGSESGIIANNEYLHSIGYKSLCYLQPRVDKDRYTELWDEGTALDHFTRDAFGYPYVLSVFINLIHMTQFNISLIDFTHQGVDQWWHGILQTVLDLNYDGTMYDFGEYTPPDSHFADGNTGEYWHNPYPLIYQRSGFNFFSGLDDDTNDGIAPDILYFVRSGYSGSQNWTYAMWSGDPEADWSVSDGLPAQVVGGINAGLSGMPVWGSDIGGYHALLVPAPTAELPKRWYQFGAFCGLMRDMTAAEFTAGSRILPFDDSELTFIIRKYQKLRTQLVPYIFNAALTAHETGMPLMGAPLLYNPDDPAVWDVVREYYFGPDIYVAPIVEEFSRQRTLYLPQGQWIEFWDKTEYDGDMAGNGTGGFRIGGSIIEGGQTITVDAPIDEIPIFIKAGAVIPLVDYRVDTFAPAIAANDTEVTYAEELADLLYVWAFPKGTSSTRLSDGSLLEVDVTGTGVALTRTAPADDAELVIQMVWPENFAAPSTISGLSFVQDADPLDLVSGQWTWSPLRNSVAFHGTAGQINFQILE